MEEKEQESSELLKQEKFRRDLTLLEAALYVAGRPLELRTLGTIIKTRSKEKVRRLVKTLLGEYKSRDTALEILELEGDRFVLQLKAEYTPKVRRLATRPLLSSGPLKTLSYIAYRQPVLQPQVIDVRGHHAYGHLRQLEDLDLITRERAGRTKVIRTTEFFADYFGLSQRQVARNIKKLFREMEEKQEQSNG